MAASTAAVRCTPCKLYCHPVKLYRHHPVKLYRRREADDDDNMEDWDQEQLEKVIADKHAKEKSNATSIICRNFLDAVERKQYGWWGFRPCTLLQPHLLPEAP
jgi:hypothetical protein